MPRQIATCGILRDRRPVGRDCSLAVCAVNSIIARPASTSARADGPARSGAVAATYLEAVSGKGSSDRDCFVAALLAMTPRQLGAVSQRKVLRDRKFVRYGRPLRCQGKEGGWATLWRLDAGEQGPSTSSFWGADSAREPGTRAHRPTNAGMTAVFMGSGPARRASRNDQFAVGVFPYNRLHASDDKVLGLYSLHFGSDIQSEPSRQMPMRRAFLAQ